MTYFLCLYFGKRFGYSHDFERTLGMFGLMTGTVPCGLALIRIVDPDFKTPTNIELGLMNLLAYLMYFPIPIMVMMAARSISMTVGYLLLLLAPIPIYLILLKVLHLWGKPTFSLKKTDS